MGIFGTVYHGLKAGYKMIKDESFEASEELDKAVESLKKTVVDPIGFDDMQDIIVDND